MLIVGCGCRGRSLAGALIADGHAVRGTTRDPAATAAIEAAGAEAVVADPDRLATLLPAIEGVSVLCWLLAGAAKDLHGPRLASMLEKLVDTHVRGFVYEEAQGAAIVRRAHATWGMPVAIVDADPADHDAWLAAMRSGVSRVLA